MGIVSAVAGTSIICALRDTIYKPVELVCDAIRAPFKIAGGIIDDKRKLSYEKKHQEIINQTEKFKADLEIERQKRMMEMTLEEKKREEEIYQWAQDVELDRNIKMIELEKKCRLEMTEAAGKFAERIASVHLEVREKLLPLYFEKQNSYIDLQEQRKKKLFLSIEEIKKLFPGEEGTKVAIEEYITQSRHIEEMSVEFVKTLTNDMNYLLKTITDDTSSLSKIAENYLSPNSSGRSIKNPNREMIR